MPKRYGVKDKDIAAAHIVSRLLSGDLRPGDRIDRTEIAGTLGMSRVPVQEAVNQLERDGIVTIPYHRGVFLERFDPEVVREHYEIYGMLSAIAAARAARRHSPELVAQLHELVRRMAAVATPDADPAEFEDLVWEFRRAINQEVAGPRLRAAISTFQGFMPTAFWVTAGEREEFMLPLYGEEVAAIERGDPDGAREVVTRRTGLMAEDVVTELRRRGVFTEDPPAGEPPTGDPPAGEPRTGEPRAEGDTTGVETKERSR
jgi:DNA-binding GntR family transcriptional regulator